MRLGTLDSKHPTYDAERWCRVEALVKGGKMFHDKIRTFLPQNPVEPDDVYEQRIKQAHYLSYSASIINLYTSWLFAAAFSVKAYHRGTKDAIENIDSFYGEFQEDVGNETQLSSFIKERFREALTVQNSYWLVELPSNDGRPAENAKEFAERGLGRATLKPIARCELFDWEEDAEGALIWAIVHTCYDERASWRDERDMTVETWRVYDRENVYTFQLRYKKGQRPRDPNFEVPQIGEAQRHGFKRVPIVRLCLPAELTIGEVTYDPQLEHFRIDNALSWLIRRTCYAQPVFNIEDGENGLPRMGTGYAIILGKEDKMGWTSPPVAPFDILQKNLEAKRDEIYRVVHQMAQGLDNNAETVGRSAESKEIDAAATRIMLNVYGAFVSEKIEETYEIISEARGEMDYEWSVEGFSGYDTATVSSLLENAKQARALGIPSQTFHKELCTKVALALHPEADQRVKDAIRSEIAKADFEVSSMPIDEARIQGVAAKAELDRAKAAAEQIKAKASIISAKQPKAPAVPGNSK